MQTYAETRAPAATSTFVGTSLGRTSTCSTASGCAEGRSTFPDFDTVPAGQTLPVECCSVSTHCWSSVLILWCWSLPILLASTPANRLRRADGQDVLLSGGDCEVKRGLHEARWGWSASLHWASVTWRRVGSQSHPGKSHIRSCWVTCGP